jgi:hypothetical protein
MKALRFRLGVERDRILCDAGYTEVVADAADTEHQRVVGYAARRQNFAAVVIVYRVERKLMSRAIESRNGALTKAKAMPVRQREIVGGVRVGVHAAGGDFVQQRLPDVRLESIDQRNLGLAVPAQLVAKRRCQR